MATNVDKNKPYRQATGLAALIAAVFGVLYATGVDLPVGLEAAVIALVGAIGNFVTAFTNSKAIEDAFFTPPPPEAPDLRAE